MYKRNGRLQADGRSLIQSGGLNGRRAPGSGFFGPDLDGWRAAASHSPTASPARPECQPTAVMGLDKRQVVVQEVQL